MSSTRTRIAASIAAAAGIAALAAAPARPPPPDTECHAGRHRHPARAPASLTTVAKNGVTVGDRVSLGVARATASPRASPSTPSSRSPTLLADHRAGATASSSTPGAADPSSAPHPSGAGLGPPPAPHRHGRPGPRWWSRPPLAHRGAAGGWGRSPPRRVDPDMSTLFDGLDFGDPATSRTWTPPPRQRPRGAGQRGRGAHLGRGRGRRAGARRRPRGGPPAAPTPRSCSTGSTRSSARPWSTRAARCSSSPAPARARPGC